MENNEKDLEEQLMQALAGLGTEEKKEPEEIVVELEKETTKEPEAEEIPTLIIGPEEVPETGKNESGDAEDLKELEEEIHLDPVVPAGTEINLESENETPAKEEPAVIDDTKDVDLKGLTEEKVDAMIQDLDEDAPAQYKGKELQFDEVEDPDETIGEKVSRRNRNQPTAEDLHKESVRFWVFTAVIAVLVIGAVLFILYSRGILSNIFNKENETNPGITIESQNESDETESESESETESESESQTESQSEQEDDKESVLKHYENIFVSDGETVLRVRKEASTESKIIATLEQFAGGNILEQSGEWYHIQSGGINGYVKAEFVKTGEDAKKLALEHCEKRVVSNSDTLNVREKPSTEEGTKVLVTVTKGTNFAYLGEEGNFYKVKYGYDYEGYVSKDFTTYGYYLEEAVEFFE